MSADDFEVRNARRVVYSQTAPDGKTIVHYVLRAADPHRQFRASGAQLTAIGEALRAGREPELPPGTVLERNEVSE